MRPARTTYPQMEKIILKAIYLFLIACLATFTLTPAWAGDNTNAQTTMLSVDLWDYCDPATFGAALCARANTSSGAITRAGFGAELTPREIGRSLAVRSGKCQRPGRDHAAAQKPWR